MPSSPLFIFSQTKGSEKALDNQMLMSPISMHYILKLDHHTFYTECTTPFQFNHSISVRKAILKQKAKHEDNRKHHYTTSSQYLIQTDPAIFCPIKMENTSQRHRELHREIKVIESHQPKVIITGGEEVKIKSDSMGPRGYVEFIRDRVWAVCLFGR